MVTNVSHITARHWQPALGSFGEIVEGLDDVNQAIGIIVQTPKGSVPLRPEFGSDVWRYIDLPLAQAAPKIRQAALDALAVNEPRIAVRQVTVSTADAASGRLSLKISWTLADGLSGADLEVPL